MSNPHPSRPEKAGPAVDEDIGPLPGNPASESSLIGKEDLLALQDIDPALDAKMHIVNDAIDEIGWTPYHWKLFVLNGFGYAVDSMLILLQSIIAGQAALDFKPSYTEALTIAVYVGMLFGALFWGLSADVIGRRFAFNISLFICAISVIAAGAAPSWPSLGFFIAMTGFGGGGNLILDTTVFLEYLPSYQQWVLTWLSSWWGLGQAVAGFIAWGFMSPAKWSCASQATCTYDNNKGWRYLMYTSGVLVFVMSVLRITIIRLRETPKYLLGEGNDAKVVEGFQKMATKYNRHCSITLEMLEACGSVRSVHGKSKLSLSEVTTHFRGLFASNKISLSTMLIWFSWALIGIAYPLFYVFLPNYLKTRGAAFGKLSTFETWRNYALVNISGIPGPMLAGHMANWKLLGRRYTMTIGALLTMAFFFAYTQVRSEPQNIGFSCSIAFCLNIYYGTLYAYTSEVLPSAHRATGNGIAVACNRVGGIMSAVIAGATNTSTSVPLWVCSALFGVMAIVAALFPFEPFGRRSS